MMKTVAQGRCSHILRSMATSAWIATTVLIRRMLGRPLVAQWPFLVEYGTLFFRAQFNHAFRLSHTIAESRAYFDSVYGLLETYPDVDFRLTDITPVIGTHVGPGALGIGWTVDTAKM